MATQYSTISQSNFSTSWAQTITKKGISTYYIYICAPCWYISGSPKTGSTQTWNISYYNGSSWVSAYDWSWWGGGVWFYGHNRDEGNLDKGFNNEYPLWRFSIQQKGNSTYFTFYAGGYGLAKNTSTDALYYYPQEKRIYSTGQANVFIYDSSSQNDSYVLNTYFNSTNRRGSKIYAANNDAELVWYPYK